MNINMEYRERMQKMGELRIKVQKCIDMYRKVIPGLSLYDPQNSNLFIYDNQGLVSKLKLGEMSTMETKRKHHPLNEALLEFGFYPL